MFQFLSAASTNPTDSVRLAEIGAALLILGIVAFIANRLKFSVVPLYLLIGLAIGDGGLVPMELSEEFLDTGSQIGAIMLLLLLGLEYSAYDLSKAFKERKSAGLIDFLANSIPGFVLGLLLGWGIAGAFALAGITYVSSSGIAAQLIKEMGWRRSEVAKRATGILVFEDLALAPYLPLLTSVVLGVAAWSGFLSVAIALAITGLVILISFKGSSKLVKILDPSEPGGLLLTVFGAALLAAGLADLVGFSGVVAAFLIGLLLTGEVAETARARLSPIRDIFAAIFFLFFGLSVSPAEMIQVLPLALLLAALGIVGDGFQFRVFFRVLGRQFFTLELALDQSYFSHVTPQFLKGKRKAVKSALHSSSDLAVVVMLMLRPRKASTLSYSISGKMICSLTPML